MEVLTVKNEFGKRERLELVEAHKGHDTLGIVLTLDSNMVDKTKLLKKKIAN